MSMLSATEMHQCILQVGASEPEGQGGRSPGRLGSGALGRDVVYVEPDAGLG